MNKRPCHLTFVALTALMLTAVPVSRVEASDVAVTEDQSATQKVEHPVPPGFALIPAGEFMMGDALDGEKDAPVIKVKVSAFYIAKREVTKALWDEVRGWGASHGYSDLSEGEGKATNHPVSAISWHDIVKWCNARSEKEKLKPCFMVGVEIYRTGENDAVVCNWAANGYRLPTEAEWEKAARGGLSGKRFPWGDTISHTNANFYNNGEQAYQTGTTEFHPTYETESEPYTSPVGSFAPNGYGLYDMAGNAWEWCWDWYGPYPESGATDPHGATLDTDQARRAGHRVVRGGGWDCCAVDCRVASRYFYSPTSSDFYFGFRVARSSVP